MKQTKTVEKIAKALNTSVDVVKDIQRAGRDVWNYIAQDIGPSHRRGKNAGLWRRVEVIELVMDASRLETLGHLKPESLEVLRRRNVETSDLIVDALKLEFTYEWCE